MAAAVWIIIILGAISRRRNNRHSVHRSCWVRPWIRRRPLFGAFHALLKELSTEELTSFRNFLRMDQTTFEELLTLSFQKRYSTDPLLVQKYQLIDLFYFWSSLSFLLVTIFFIYIIYTRGCMMHLPLTLFSMLLIGSYYQNPILHILK